MIPEPWLPRLAERLGSVDGVVGVVLGGSRARGAAGPDSDVDLGIYYSGPLDVAAVQALASEISDSDAEVTAPGGWGPWVDGGGWLTIDGTPVDFIYRDIERVRAACSDAQAGRYAFHFQVGHPLGVPDIAYAGEIGLARVLNDPTGALTSIHESMARMPEPLRTALVHGIWEADFLLGGARKPARRGDATYVAGCIYRIVGVALHALHGHAGRWLINDKGAVASAVALAVTAPDFGSRVHAALANTGTSPEQLNQSLDRTAALVAEVKAVCGQT